MFRVTIELYMKFLCTILDLFIFLFLFYIVTINIANKLGSKLQFNKIRI